MSRVNVSSDLKRENDVMAMHYVLQGLFVLIGLVSFLAACLDWDWFFESRNISMLVRNGSRIKARLFYGAVGLLLMATGCFFFYQVYSLANVS